ncbi:penicillin-binding protein [Streptomyces pluripotens]|uniref:Penicillin-binding protein n=1 Tax=Streptomyces pluripotens TaxID=1355015 RepID=A0A221P271_9ACTN|nr:MULTISPECIES: transglycosylase domain-containing protein [Streptomyces]ARP72074.1 penicillin-binding protein [Streptomyces pluripotens]ASN26321.1 penicillin-binding protein [Streptomyces pluripotens]KIE26479.1 penicillin-binding protein [Streptomyces sp. MUSC 125]MCH0555931.1 penicillin-binding protein [Streptomyces sp. MUM 16J]
MGRAEERRARQRGGRRAASKGRRSAPTVGTGSTAAPDKPDQPKKSLIRRMFTWKKILGTIFGTCLLAIAGFIGLYLYVDVPPPNLAAQQQSNVYKFSDGTLLARSGKTNREIVGLSKVPRKVQLTFVAAENKTFYKDAGVDFKGTARALLNTLAGKGKQGGSTITQQYVKNYYLNQDQTVTRKLKELVIALKVDREKSKDDILAGYINTSYYGRNAYGIQAAAQAYYRVDAQDLTVEQGAYLAALLQAPSQYDWAVATPTSKRLVKARWNYVLNNMVEQGWLPKTKRDAMKFPTPKAPKPDAGLGGQKGYLVGLANQQLEQQLMAQDSSLSQTDAEKAVIAKGWTITLNIDRKKQAALEKAVKSQLTGHLDKKKRRVDGYVQPGAVSVDPKTGGIVALYGGQDYYAHYSSNATRRDFQPASTFKPVILAAALRNNATTQDGKQITADTIYDGNSRRQAVDHGVKVGFAPPNEDNQSYGSITVQKAMNLSVNSVFAQMGVDVGMDKVMDTAKQLGMDTKGMQAVPAQTLGSMGASPLEMAGIYATFANHGKKVTPSILKSAERTGRSVQLPDAVGDSVISRTAADTVTSVLTGVVDDGTAHSSVEANSLRDGQQVAGKTGTSDCNRSAWFTGYTPDLVTSVGLFGEADKAGGTNCDGRPIKKWDHVSMKGAMGKGRVDGGGPPARIWAAYTFGVTKKAEFDLDTAQGAAVEPTQTQSASPSQSPTQTPSQTPTSESPTTEPPTTEPPTSAPPTTEPPSPPQSPGQSPTQTPSQTPTSQEPTGDGTPPSDPLASGGQ